MGLGLWVWFGGIGVRWWDCGFVVWIMAVRDKKGALCGCFRMILVLYVVGGKFAPGSCLICENLSTLQNSQNFVNFHLSKNKGWDFKQSHP